MARLGVDEYAAAIARRWNFFGPRLQAKFPDPGRSDIIFIPSHLFHPLHIDAARDVAPRAQ